MNKKKLLEKYKNNSLLSGIYKFTKVMLPIILLSILFKNSYISLDLVNILFLKNIFLLLIIIFFSFLLSFLLYFRWYLCLNIYKKKINFLRLIQVSSQAYGFASFIPGQIGVDALRIGKFRKLDSTKFKTTLLKSTLIEKFFALVSQLFIISTFIHSNNFNRILFITGSSIFIYFLIYLIRKLEFYKPIKKYFYDFNFKNIYTIFSYSVFCNIVSCYLIYLIANGLNMQYSFSIMALSSTFSNISAIIPLSPNGLGISEFIFSAVTQKISSIDNLRSVATIYFTYRVLLIITHFSNYYVSRCFKIKKYF